MMPPQRILIVEDEPLIAMMLEDFLEALDHVVAGTADCIAAALSLIEANAPDAAILDVNLRGGEKSTPIARKLADLDIPFVFATGGGQDGIDNSFHDRPHLQKPFTMDSVEKALNAL